MPLILRSRNGTEKISLILRARNGTEKFLLILRSRYAIHSESNKCHSLWDQETTLIWRSRNAADSDIKICHRFWDKDMPLILRSQYYLFCDQVSIHSMIKKCHLFRDQEMLLILRSRKILDSNIEECDWFYSQERNVTRSKIKKCQSSQESVIYYSWDQEISFIIRKRYISNFFQM